MTSSLPPVLFISHGAPTFALEPGELGAHLNALGKSLSPKAILVISPHWQTRGLQIMATAMPSTVHDFRGFPAPLYELRYPVPGAPTYATHTQTLLQQAGLNSTLDLQRGLDHGAWVPLSHLFPTANVPVFQLSMPLTLSTESAYQLGQALRPLRQQGVLIVGSGSLTHNLYELQAQGSDEAPYAAEFRDWIRQSVMTQDTSALIHYRTHAPHAVRAHPTEEHFLPLLIALGAAGDEKPSVIEGEMTYGVLSMESYGWGIEASE